MAGGRDERQPGAGPWYGIKWVVGGLGLLVVGFPLLAGGFGDVEAGRRKAEVCAPCHGADGNSTTPEVPSLAGQPPLYTYYQLLLFQQQQRVSAQMAPVVASLSRQDMQDLAAYYAVQTPAVPPPPRDPAKAEVGRRLVKAHYCDSCHAPGLVGQKHIPRLAGQHYAYLVTQLRAYKTQQRTDLDGTMTIVAQPLSNEEIEALAEYLASLPAGAGLPRPHTAR